MTSGRWAAAALLVALVMAGAAPARAQTSQALVGLPLVTAEDQLEEEGRFVRVEGLPDDVDPADALVVGVDVIEDPDGSTWVLSAGTRVPSVVERGLVDAQQAIRDVALEPVLDDGLEDETDTDGIVVRAQRPDPDSLVPFGQIVALEIAVRVPDLAGLSSDEAEAAAADARLGLDASGPSDGNVASQEPQPDDLVPISSSVAVRLQVPLVTVPDLDGLSTAAALDRLAAVPLRLSATVEGDSALARATGQTPAADERVPRNSPVAVTFAVPVVAEEGASGGDGGGDGESLPVWMLLVAVLVLALIAGATLLRSSVRRRRERRWVREQVRYRPWAGRPRPPQLQELDPAAGLSVRTVARPDPGHQVLEEVRP